MSSTLESSVTLDDVFVVVGARRVPLAAELAGYLALEIAEGAMQLTGDVDPRSVYIGEEGSVALVVRPRREREPRDPRDPSDAETSIRALLGRLLEASGSQTPALAATARRHPSSGMGLLVEELEAALIPVNRAAGRRALARLAREVKRVTLGVGRNASLAPGEPAPRRASSPSHTSMREGAGASRTAQDDARLARSAFVDEPPPSSRQPPPADVPPAPPPQRTEPAASPATEAPPLAGPPPAPSSASSPEASELPTIEVRRSHAEAALAASPEPGIVSSGGSPAPPAIDEVDHLLASFGVSSRGEQSQRNELKALVGLEPTPPPPGSGHPDDAEHARALRRETSESDVESLLAISDSGPPVAVAAAPKAGVLASPPTAISPVLAREPYRASGKGQAAASGSTATSPQSRLARETRDRASSPSQPDVPRGLPTAPSARRLAEMSSQPNIPRDRSMTVFAVVVLALGAGAIWVLRPAIFGADARPAPSALTPVPTAAPPSAASRCRASLVVTGAPANAEILLRAGQGPVDVEKMPVGARLEFVATAEGYAPKRAVVPAGATWDTGSDGKPRYEVAVQLDRSRARPGGVDPWPAGEPGSEVGGKGSPGTVHLVTTPRGAEVWQLAALGPEAQFDVKCGGEVEVLVAGPTTLRKRLRVPEGDFTALDGGAAGTERQATVSAK